MQIQHIRRKISAILRKHKNNISSAHFLQSFTANLAHPWNNSALYKNQNDYVGNRLLRVTILSYQNLKDYVERFWFALRENVTERAFRTY